MATFLEALRRPKKLGRWADDGRIRAGEPDLVLRAFDRMDRQMRSDNDGTMQGFGGGGNLGRIARGQENTRPMNVVYNQAPEMAQKQFNFMKDQAALEQKNKEKADTARALSANDDFIQQRRENEMKQRGMETNAELAKAKLALELGDREKLQLENQNRMAQIAAQQTGAEKIAQMNASARGASDIARIRAAEIAAGKPTAANTMSPAEESQMRFNKAHEVASSRPDLAELLEFSDDGKTFNIKPSQDTIALEMLNNAIYGRRGDINLGGVRSAALGGSLGSAGASGNIAERGSPTAAYQKGTPTAMTRKVRNKRTGQVIEQTSMDGGQTWR